MRSALPKLMAGGLLLAGLAVPALSTPQSGQAPAPAPAPSTPSTLPSHDSGQQPSSSAASTESKPAAGAEQAPHPNPLEQLIKGRENEPVEAVFKNIQVLKGLPAGRLLDTMRGFSGALGTNCKKCHDTENFASDAKDDKKVARGMIQMTKGINEQFLKTMPGLDEDATVSCYTCHHGKSHPASKPESAEGEHEHEHGHH
ncbi:MAG: c-type cytochrome [Thermoanaerobaculia bacterium]